MTAAPRQFPLPFVHVDGYGPDFLAAASNSDALTWLGRTAEWPQGRLALWGEAGCGKTHLLHHWARRHGIAVLSGRTLKPRPAAAPLAIDDADTAPERPLLHTLNTAAEAGHPVLLAARDPPARWPVALADLASRLRATTAVQIEPADDGLLRTLLAKLLAERGLAVPGAVQAYMLHRLPRTAAAMREAAARLDRFDARPDRRLARDVLAAMAGADAGADDTEIVPDPSRAEPRLL